MKDFETEAGKAAYIVAYGAVRGIKDRGDYGRVVARLLSDMVNSEAGWETSAFVEFWNQEHRTLQQGFTQLVARWLDNLNKREKDGFYDARNAYSMGFAKGAMEGLKEFKFTPDCMSMGLPSNPYEYDFDSYGDEIGFPHI